MDESVVKHLEQQNEVADVLRRARSAIADPKDWWHCTPAVGEKACAVGEKACAWIAIGRQFTGIDNTLTWAAGRYFSTAIGAPSEALQYVFNWNDAPERTHAEVLAAFDKAIELAQGY